MSEELKKKLATEIEECDWSLLRDHYKRQALVLVEPDVDLVDAGVALALDDAESVKAWQAKNWIRKPTENEVDSWEGDPYKRLARFVIVQPFVLIQLVEEYLQ
jgi:hypothetical protein